MGKQLEWIEVTPGVQKLSGKIDTFDARRVLDEQKLLSATQPWGPVPHARTPEGDDEPAHSRGDFLVYVHPHTPGTRSVSLIKRTASRDSATGGQIKRRKRSAASLLRALRRSQMRVELGSEPACFEE